MTDDRPTVPFGSCHLPPRGWRCTLDAGHEGPCPTWRARPGFVHNVVAHPLLVLLPRLGEWLHERSTP